MKKLVIDESKWYRGNGDRESRLLRSDGTMCCLGFFCLANGLDEGTVLDEAFPTDVDWQRADELGLTVEVDAPNLGYQYYPRTAIEKAIGRINDARAIDDAERKKMLEPLFAKLGWELEFIPGDGK